jgi:putative two-component system response regulator
MKILIVDDNNTNLRLLTSMVQKLRDCAPIPFSSPADALAAMPELEFDVAILDYMMPVYNGVEFLTEMLHFEKYAGVPVIFVTADLDMTTRMDALNAGAIDFLTKPVDFQEFKARVQNIAALAEARRKHAESLSAPAAAGMGTIREQEREIIQRITLAAGYKDPHATSHRMRVAAYSEAIARAAGLPEELCLDIRLAAALFDNVTALASDMSLLKRGKMTEADFRRRANPGEGSENSSLLQLAAEIARTYRERFDGQGYPSRLKGGAIPDAGRIVAIAASFDALISERQFKQAWPFEKAASHIRGKAGSHFDPTLVAAFEAALGVIHDVAYAGTVPMGSAAA